MIKVEHECARVDRRVRRGRLGFGGVGEAVQFGEVEGAVGVLDVAEDAAGADGGELLIIADQPDTRPRSMAYWMAVSRVRVSAIPASSMMIRVAGPMCGRPVGQVIVLEAPGEFGQGVGVDAGVLGEDGGCGGGWGEADDLSAGLGPGQGEGAHRGGLSGAGGRDRQLDPGAGGAHLADQGCLPGIKRGAVRRHFQQRQLHGG